MQVRNSNSSISGLYAICVDGPYAIGLLYPADFASVSHVVLRSRSHTSSDLSRKVGVSRSSRLTSQPVMDSSVVTRVPPCSALNVHVCIARVPSATPVHEIRRVGSNDCTSDRIVRPPLFHSNVDVAATGENVRAEEIPLCHLLHASMSVWTFQTISGGA